MAFSLTSVWSLALLLPIVLAVWLFVVLVTPQLARFRFRGDLTWYDLGLYGFAPARSYNSFEYESPRFEFLQTDARCSRDYLFLAPRGDSIPEPAGMIVDPEGELVWRNFGLQGITQDFRVQTYRGENFLTFWVGEERDGRKQGSWYMLDSSYTLRYAVIPGGNVTGDMHEFQLTPSDTALITIYHPIPGDLSGIGGPVDGWILDGVFQEIDIETGNVLFEWRASEHIPVDRTFKTLQGCQRSEASAFTGCGEDESAAFDFYHINSIDKDSRGNYLVSGRHTFTVSYVDGRTGAVLWNLGGKENDFHDLSDGAATDFSWQHHARWYGDSAVTLFDNSADDNSDPSVESRALVIDLGLQKNDHLSAKLRTVFHNPQRMEAASQGSVQILSDSGTVLVGWGHSAAFTEFAAADGRLLCDAHFGASAYFTFGRVSSYRVFKGKWTGHPREPPNAVILDRILYVSWNGATEVTQWQVEVTNADDDNDSLPGESFILSQVYKDGFETEIPLPDSLGRSLVRVVALNAAGDVLGRSELLEVPAEAVRGPEKRIILLTGGISSSTQLVSLLSHHLLISTVMTTTS
ncbi:hypothetical protein ASPZODRAFT_148133 [Penicilliopsis zonata CBS 506.65]|uniref:ASST-domain-containing protein n=1 Tax=Penicilliopsis zonata CBS 506.65 TaxID=1073090 RepID=A0A1L9SUE1_9EURO|nr:hypothetical protein ASPZODRAFT_148133 [Penicilliopsis zonata CBS 506.65]OJJ50683.1 hypothetical protein ASPZODRAFT_148133 [Penicilliopsis zonata CBS 506.65]